MMRRAKYSAALLCLALCQMAHAQSFDLGAAFNAVKGLAQTQSLASMTDEQEVAVGRDVAASTLSAYPPLRDERLQRKLNSVGLWVALQSPRPELPWRFAAVDSPSINAFAAPGGTIMVTRGLLGMIENEAELACVLGHEIGHVSRKHHLAVLQKSLLADVGVNAWSAYSGQDNELKKRLLGEGKELFNRSLDRGAEREADEDGVLLAAKAGYDPGACLSFMQRLAAMKDKSNALQALYKTHPQATDRAVDIEAALKRLQGAAAGDGAKPAFVMTSKK